MGIRLGMQARLYRNTGTYAAPVWAAMDNVRDLTLNLESGECDVSTRANNGFKATMPTLKDASIEFESIYDPSDQGFSALQTAYFSNGTVEVAVMDGAIDQTGTQGLRATMSVMKFTRSEPLTEAIKVSISLKPAYAQHAPQWMVAP
jgi:hypothetical protein